MPHGDISQLQVSVSMLESSIDDEKLLTIEKLEDAARIVKDEGEDTTGISFSKTIP